MSSKETKKCKWLKYRHKFSYGPRDWRYHRCNEKNPEELSSLLEELASEYAFSEHYRGVDYEFVMCPPEEVYEQLLEYHTLALQRVKKDIAEDSRELTKYYPPLKGTKK